MEDRSTDRPRFDERAALAELERLREQIARRRSERRETGEEFERFVRSFRKPRFVGPPAPRTSTPHPTPPVAAPKDDVPAPAAPVVDGATASGSPAAVEPGAPIREPEVVSATEPAVVASAEREAAVTGPELATIAGPAQGRNRVRVIGGGALLLLVATGFAAWTLRQRPAPAPSASTAPSTPGPAREIPAKSPVNAPTVGQSEIVTSRRAWIRVTVDGERVLEREVPAGTRVPLTARKTIVIRTGDAGAVRVSIDGRDQGVLGGAGQVVTRTFTVPATPER